MKKYFFLIALTTLLISSYATPYIPPVSFMEIEPSLEIMNMDGSDSEGSWGIAQEMTLFNTSGWDNDADFSAWFKLCWDEDYLYIFVDITDEYNHSFDGSNGNSWEFDNIEIYMDLDTNNSSTSYDDATTQLRFCRGFTSPEAFGRADAGDFLYDYSEKSGNSGWIVEAGIPWTCVMPTGSLPEDINDYVNNVMGFDINFADSDNSDGDYLVGNRDVQGSWDMDGGDGSEDLAWNNTSVFGIVELLAEPIPPAIPYTDPVRILSVPARDVAIVIDGQATETSWSDLQDVSLFNTAGYSDPDDFDAGFRLSWDYEYLYFFAEITDDIDHSFSEGLADEWMFDNIELFVDLDTVMGSTSYDENTAQLRFCRGLDEVRLPGRADASDFIYYWENTATGWIVEIAIPWTFVLPEGWMPDDIMYFINNKMGFDVNIADSDNSDGDAAVGNRDAHAAWDTDGLDGTEDMAWNNTHVFGIIDLIGEPAGTNPEPAGEAYVKPVRDMDIPVMNTTFNADTDDQETFWSYPQQVVVFNETDYTGDDDLDAFFRTAWDLDYLYLYAEITDDEEQNWSGTGNAGSYDNLEIYIDLDTFSMETDYRDNSTAMIRFCRGNASVQSTGRATASEFSYTWENTETGWKLEAAIPWTAALETGASVSALDDFLPTIGFDVTVNDLDGVTAPGRDLITQAAWDADDDAPGEDEAMDNTRMFGITNLSPYGFNELETEQQTALRIYPNPANEKLFIASEKPLSRVQVFHVSGQLMMELSWNSGDDSIDVSHLPAGTYLIKCSFDDHSISTRLFVRQE